jgi:hypothetical protein
MSGTGPKRVPVREPVSFVIVLWLEPGRGAKPEWRWRVRQAQTGEEGCFRRLEDVLAYVTSRTGVAAPA